MVNLKIFNKVDFGKLVMPDKIYKFKYREELEGLYEKLYFDNVNYKIIANLFALSIMATLLIYIFSYDFIYTFFNSWFYKPSSKIILNFLIVLFLNFFTFYFILFLYYFSHDSKFKKNEADIERDMPEFIDNLVSNLKGGISLEKALLKSVRPEQKALLAEVTLINQKIMMGTDVYVALKQFRLRYNSPIIHRTFFLVEEGIKGGGNIAKPLERISQNLKRIYALTEEIKAGAGGFSMVIKAITMLVAPLLFALAITLLTFIGNLFKLILKAGSDILPVSELPPEYSSYLVIFSYSMIILITFFSSLITSELKNEKLHDSIKYLPIYITISIIIFNLCLKILLSFFGDVI